VITGYNTDVEYGGVVYHVQTEDKGLATPIILSLVYTGGAILASKRSPYDDLIASGFDEAVLAERLQRQHRLICAAVHAGRIDDLKRMSDRPGAVAEKGPTPEQAEVSAEQSPPPVEITTGALMAPDAEPEVPKPGPSGKGKRKGAVSEDTKFPISEAEREEEVLKIVMLEDNDLHAGKATTLRVQVTRAAENRREPVSRARVTVKTLGTSFKPEVTVCTSDENGVAVIPVKLPLFKRGRAAILVHAESNGEEAELRRIILPSQ
jgi:hypothetical protein